MSITKPFTFVAGTKARANEVNADFDTLYTQVNVNISDIANNYNNINLLETNKANINGDNSQAFNVADINYNSTTQAVNANSLREAIYPVRNYIYGLTITKDSSSPNNTIIVGTGNCYDQSHKVVMKLNSSATKQNTGQAASTTYHVYLISSNADGSNPSVAISTNSSQPSDPAPTRYRRIGRFTTNSDNKIDTINSFRNNVSFGDLAFNVSSPNYSTNVTLTFTSGMEIGFNGWLYIRLKLSGYPNQASAIRINNHEVCYCRSGSDGGSFGDMCVMVPVRIGDVITQQGDTIGTDVYLRRYDYM